MGISEKKVVKKSIKATIANINKKHSYSKSKSKKNKKNRYKNKKKDDKNIKGKNKKKDDKNIKGKKNRNTDIKIKKVRKYNKKNKYTKKQSGGSTNANVEPTESWDSYLRLKNKLDKDTQSFSDKLAAQSTKWPGEPPRPECCIM
jgi:hypothetical protein